MININDLGPPPRETGSHLLVFVCLLAFRRQRRRLPLSQSIGHRDDDPVVEEEMCLKKKTNK